MEHKVDTHCNGVGWPWWSSSSRTGWNDDGQWSKLTSSDRDLIEFLRPLEDLPPTLNSAVKAAEDRHRELRAHAKAARELAEAATRLADEALIQLERLEKECEVGK